MAGTGLIKLEWWALPAWTLLAFWPFTVFAVTVCIIAALQSRNARIPSAFADAWVILGACFLLLLALIAEIIVLPAPFSTVSDKLFLAWGFLGLAYMAITAAVLVTLYRRKFSKR